MTALIILAAGESKRLGQPKQKLLYKGKTLLERAVETGLASDCATVIVVLGAHSNNLGPFPETAMLYNDHWKDGMASSIKLAMLEIDNAASFDNVIIMVCDQPFVDRNLLNTLIKKQEETGSSIVASAYQGTIGVPALFDNSLFPSLLQLKGKEGAKMIIKAHMENMVTVPFEKGVIDIDTPEDYQQLLSN